MYEFELAQYADVIGVHAQGYGSAPEAELNSNPAFAHPSFYFRRVEQLRDIMALNGDGSKPFWVLEFGWTTDQVDPEHPWYAVTPEQQAEYIVRAYQYAKTNWAPQVGPMFVWNIADPVRRLTSSTGGRSPTPTSHGQPTSRWRQPVLQVSCRNGRIKGVGPPHVRMASRHHIRERPRLRDRVEDARRAGLERDVLARTPCSR